MRKPSWVLRRERELRDAGISREQLATIRSAYVEVGLDLNRCDGKGWRLFAIHPSKPITYVLWGSLASLIDTDYHIDAYRSILAQEETR